MADSPPEVTRAVYATLRQLASRRLGAAGSRKLQVDPTDIVHETFVKLCAAGVLEEDERGTGEYLAIAATALRHVLVDMFREHEAAKRGADRQRVTLTGELVADREEVDLLALDEALTKLEGRSPRQARIVELRFFAGLSVDETAAALGVAPRTVDGDWRMAKAWLKVELGA